jgi:hypothetical protein
LDWIYDSIFRPYTQCEKHTVDDVISIKSAISCYFTGVSAKKAKRPGFFITTLQPHRHYAIIEIISRQLAVFGWYPVALLAPGL